MAEANSLTGDISQGRDEANPPAGNRLGRLFYCLPGHFLPGKRFLALEPTAPRIIPSDFLAKENFSLLVLALAFGAMLVLKTLLPGQGDGRFAYCSAEDADFHQRIVVVQVSDPSEGNCEPASGLFLSRETLLPSCPHCPGFLVRDETQRHRMSILCLAVSSGFPPPPLLRPIKPVASDSNPKMTKISASHTLLCELRC